MTAAYWTCITENCDGEHHVYVAAHSLAELDAAEDLADELLSGGAS